MSFLRGDMTKYGQRPLFSYPSVQKVICAPSQLQSYDFEISIPACSAFVKERA